MERGRAFCLRVELIWKQLVELGRSLWTKPAPATGQLQVVEHLRSQPTENRVLQVAAALEVFLNIQLDKQLSALPNNSD